VKEGISENNRTREFLEQQIKATKEESDLLVNTLMLVGGFGESPNLLNKIKEWCPDGIGLINPPRS